VRDGIIKAYAVASDTRLARAPDIPTFAEMGVPAVLWSSWMGLFAPRGTPRDIIDKLNAAAVEALADPLVRSRIADLGYDTVPRERERRLPACKRPMPRNGGRSLRNSAQGATRQIH
jgi:tripartite-type tricarboxylate transporter receptor subunit TctC